MVQSNARQLHQFATVIGLAIFAVICVGALTGILVLATEIILILFLGILFGVFLTRLSRLLSQYTSLAYYWSLAATMTSLVLLFFGFLALFGTQLHSRISQAREHFDEGVQQLQEWTQRFPAAESVLLSTPFLREVLNDSAINASGEQQSTQEVTSEKDDATSKQKSEKSSIEKSSQARVMEQSALRSTAKEGAMAIAGIFRSTLGLLVNSLLIFFVGLFLAIGPEQYRDGCVKLFPVDHRERTSEIMNLMGDTLWHWLIGRFATMLITGAGAGLLLAVLGIPMAFTLGIITALLTFIPNIGPAVALILAILFALPQGGTTVLYVVVGYVALQLVESYVITPMIQRKQAALPPALLIAMQALMGVLLGFLGTAVAAPILAVSKVAVEEAYIKDVLEKNEND